MSFSFVKRDGNCVAHSLAKYAKTISEYVSWLEDPPDWIEDCLSRDFSMFIQ